MRIFQTLVLCLCTLSAYSQVSQGNSTDGTYLFQKATFTVYNYNTKAEVNSRVINDPTLLNTADIFFQDVFLQAIISNESLSFCVLADHNEFIVENDIKLIPAKTIPSTADNRKVASDQNLTRQLSPYTLSIQNGVLTFSINYLYGDSKYNFPLEGKLTLTMIKQK